MLFMQTVRLPEYRALAKAGRKRAAKIAMIAITTSNSMSVNAALGLGFISLKLSILHRFYQYAWLYCLILPEERE